MELPSHWLWVEVCVVGAEMGAKAPSLKSMVRSPAFHVRHQVVIFCMSRSSPTTVVPPKAPCLALESPMVHYRRL